MDIKSLANQANLAVKRKIAGLFEDSDRAKAFSAHGADLFLDYSKQNITSVELEHLFGLARASNLNDKIQAQFSGEQINNTEKRAVLHTLLRSSDDIKRKVLGRDADQVIDTESKMKEIVDGVNNGTIVSASGQEFTDILAIGIGGSYYGVKVALSALVPFHQGKLKAHVLANVDGDAAQEKLEKLSPDKTLVVIISKTFTTQETLLNATVVKQWMLSNSQEQNIISEQWYAVSTNIEAATAFGIDSQNILPMWDWVGGRFSLWSAVGLPLALVIGYESFEQLKAGAYEMDVHFSNAPFEENLPVLLALIGIWNRNALMHDSLAILPYNHALRALPGYLQQTDMESNGKSVSKAGDKLSYLTAPVVFGQEGTNGQHAFMQLMHQSDDIIPTDFILSLAPTSKHLDNHDALVANCFAQSEALMVGKTLTQVKQELLQKGLSEQEAEFLAPHKVMKGNTPSNTILLKSLTPESLGALFALYEHKIFVQGVLWDVNSYDQWGVELGKELGVSILNVMQTNEEKGANLSGSSLALIKKYKQERAKSTQE